MDGRYIAEVQRQLGLSDTKLASALGCTRQTVANWKKGRPFPPLAANAVRWVLELRRVDPTNTQIPAHIRLRHVEPEPP